MLTEKGYHQASTKEIARVAGVAQGLINHYFPSKDMLFAIVLRNSAVSANIKETLAGKREHLMKLIETAGHLPEESARPLAFVFGFHPLPK